MENQTLTELEKHTRARKARAFERDLKAGFVLIKPHCSACRWTGEKPAVIGAGCPNCGKRITDAKDAKKDKKKEASDEAQKS